jgi:hypothetical protein
VYDHDEEPADAQAARRPAIDAFDWQAYRAVERDLDGIASADAGYHRSCQNLAHQGWDEHGVYPGEGRILREHRAEALARLAALGKPPACTRCAGYGHVYVTTGPDSCGDYWTDEEASTCPRCGGDGVYEGEAVDQPPKPSPTPTPAPTAAPPPASTCANCGG